MDFAVAVMEATGWRNLWSVFSEVATETSSSATPEAAISIRAYLADPRELLYAYPPEKGGRCRRW